MYYVYNRKKMLIDSLVLNFFFKDTATTEIYTYWHALSRHNALPIFEHPGAEDQQRHRQRQDEQPADRAAALVVRGQRRAQHRERGERRNREDRKSTRLNSSH